MRTVERLHEKVNEAVLKERDAIIAREFLASGLSKAEVARLVGRKNLVDSVSRDLAPPTGRRGWLRAYHFHPHEALRALALAAGGNYEQANEVLNSILKRRVSKRGWKRAVKLYAHLLNQSSSSRILPDSQSPSCHR